MKILNFGSLNVDYVYTVSHFVRAGETIASTNRSVFSGGKGLNQSVALARAGLAVYHAGIIGSDGAVLLETLAQNGVRTDYIQKKDVPGGHTIIQVNDEGQNCIIVHGGTNQMLTEEYVNQVLASFSAGDYLLVQNETNAIAEIMRKAKKRGLSVVLNPSPCDRELMELSLESVDYLVINEIEGMMLSETSDCGEIIPALQSRYPNTKIVLTMGEQGSRYCDGKTVYTCEAFPTKAADTTAAGDTYLGYFVYGLVKGMPADQTLALASMAAAIAVSREGAAASIPSMEEVSAGMRENNSND